MNAHSAAHLYYSAGGTSLEVTQQSQQIALLLPITSITYIQLAKNIILVFVKEPSTD